ncbi:MAG: PIN domain-containing protein [Actinomycetota bacterium]|nr:PIN domain-containing protein [Actinomycetota bacterium]
MKLVLAEPESDEVIATAAEWSTAASSVVARVEVGLAARRVGGKAVAQADRVVAALDLVPLGADIVELATTRLDPALRALDAIHVASALSLGDDLGAMLTFDRRQRIAAAAAGLSVDPGGARDR